MSDVVRRAMDSALSIAMAGDQFIDWNEREQRARDLLGRQLPDPRVYLVGDLLRPGLVVADGERVYLLSGLQASPPRVIENMVGGTSARFSSLEQALVPRVIQGQLAARPSVSLTNLIDGQRYPRARYPLNISRLAQWLRFATLARVVATDSLLDFESDVELQASVLIREKAHFVGFSLNFGEFERFADVLSAFREADYMPTIVVGNIAAQYASETVTEIAEGFNLHLARSYGEDFLVSVVEGSVHATRPTANLLAVPAQLLAPDTILFPDERLARLTAESGGQLSLETSFGCQFSKCTFCPRDHKGPGWVQGASSSEAVLSELFRRLTISMGDDLPRTISIVDEEVFGAAGLVESPETPLAVRLAEIAGRHGQTLEIYTRLEQLVSGRRSEGWNLARLADLKRIAPTLKRIFVGVESGSDTQLRRYGKGQDIEGMVPALRAGSLLGLPLEFGFITFDPLLSIEELVENLRFLGRRDVVLHPEPDLSPTDILGRVDGSQAAGEPVFAKVAYMATELEVLEKSRYLSMLRKRFPQLIGGFDFNFLRYEVAYLDPKIAEIAGTCRIWTEGTFAAMYELRLSQRAGGTSSGGNGAVLRHRYASYWVLVQAVAAVAPDRRAEVVEILSDAMEGAGDGLGDLAVAPGSTSLVDAYPRLWSWVVDGAPTAGAATFDRTYMVRRRKS